MLSSQNEKTKIFDNIKNGSVIYSLAETQLSFTIILVNNSLLTFGSNFETIRINQGMVADFTHLSYGAASCKLLRLRSWN